MYYNGEWGTVCDDEWDLIDGNVVCTELGFGPVIGVRIFAFYGQGNGQIWLDNLNCVGREMTITNCSHRGWGIHNCDHDEDAGVICADPNGM